MHRFIARIVALVLPALLLSLHVYALERKSSPDRETIFTGKTVLEMAKGKDGGLCLSSRQDGVDTRQATVCLLDNDARAELTAWEEGAEKDGVLPVKVVFGSAGALELTVRDGLEYVECKLADGQKLSVSFAAETLVVPDRLTYEDLLFNAAESGETVRVPADNYACLNLLKGGNALLACVWDNAQAKISVGKGGAEKEFSSLSFAGGGRLWLGVQGAPGIWHRVAEKVPDATALKTGWKPPFAARWYVTLRNQTGFYPEDNGFPSTWVVADKTPEKINSGKEISLDIGVGIMNAKTWTAWSSTHGTYIYPCNFEDGELTIQHSKFSNFVAQKFDPAFAPIVYPLLLKDEKNADGILPVLSAARKFLPEETAQSLFQRSSPDNKYPATCGVTATVEKIFYQDKQKEKKEEIIRQFERSNNFVANIRKRINEYMDWRKIMAVLLDDAVKQKPELAKAAAVVQPAFVLMLRLHNDALPKMQQPEDAKKITEKVIALVDAQISDENKEEQCKQLCRDYRTIGGTQDNTVAMMRHCAKCVRIKASLAYAAGGLTADEDALLLNLRREAGDIMRVRFGHEGR